MDYGNIVSSAISSVYNVIYDSGEFAAASTASSISITGLNGDTDIEYMFINRFVDLNTTGGYYIRPNNDSTAGNYGFQYIDGTGASATALRATANVLTAGYTNVNGNISLGTTNIYAKTGRVRTALTKFSGDCLATSVNQIQLNGQVWADTTNNITSFTVGAVNDLMGVGTRIVLLRKLSTV